MAKPLKQVNAFRELESSLEGAERQTRSARDRVRELGDELARTAEPSKQLTAQYRDAVNELRRLERAEGTAQQQLARRRRELQAAGIDTRNLVTEQQRLSKELQGALGAGRSEQAVSGIRAQAAALAQLTREQRASNLEGARQNLGVSRYRDLQAEIGRLRGQYQLLRSSGNLTARELAVAQRSLTTRVRETQQALRDMNAEQRRGAGALSGIGVLAGLYAAGRGLRGVTNTADQWVEINDRIRLASESQAEHAQGMERLREISDRTYTDMKNNAELYIGSLSVLRERGFTNADALNLTEALGLGLVASAAKGERAATVIDQINKALQDGELKGDAFNAVIRNTPALADALARSLGVTREQLAGLAKDGELTTDVWVPALISQVDSLGEAVDSMQVTVGDALTRLNNAWEEAIGSADTKPLIRAIEELTKVISDPVVVDNLVALASALVTLAATAAEGGSEFVDLGKRIGFIAANATGSVAELDKLDQQIKDIDRSLAGTGFNRTLSGLWYSKEELQAQRQALVAMRALLVTELSGMSDEQRQIEEERRAESERQNNAALGDYRKYIGELETLRQGQIKAAQDGAKKLVAAEKKATADLQKVRDERLKIEQRYQEALAGLGGTGEASYSSAQNLKIGARNALANGDVEGAQRLAQQALKMLQDLAAAGENTYGFRGFIQELQQIELAANDLEQSNAEDKLKSIRSEMQQLKDQAAQLKDMPVSVKTDEATIEQVRSTIESLVAQLSQKEVVIPVRVAMPDIPGTPVAAPTVPGFAGGGYTGPGGRLEPAGVVHRGEVVWSQLDIARAGGVAVVEAMRRGLRGYDMGGIVAPRAMPSIPSLAPALQQQLEGGVGERIGVDLTFGGDQVIQLEGSRQAVQDFRRLAAKFGGSSRRK
ncbi:tape measure protein [Ectopseudomonas alcaliphila]|uniref:tape measure protein n=1 Tax=Ectopseudomonas alcaliphila TaxID=101564 RepID=UPI00138FDC26|nr:tape measure protein [Pseudomonas alcaliphila]